MQPNFTLKHLGKPMLFSFLLTLCFQGLNAQKVEKSSKATQVSSKISTVDVSAKEDAKPSVSNEKIVANKFHGSKKGSLQKTKIGSGNAKVKTLSDAEILKIKKEKAQLKLKREAASDAAKDIDSNQKTSGN